MQNKNNNFDFKCRSNIESWSDSFCRGTQFAMFWNFDLSIVYFWLTKMELATWTHHCPILWWNISQNSLQMLAKWESVATFLPLQYREFHRFSRLFDWLRHRLLSMLDFPILKQISILLFCHRMECILLTLVDELLNNANVFKQLHLLHSNSGKTETNAKQRSHDTKT